MAAANQDRVLRFDPVTTERISVQLVEGSDPVNLAVGQGDAEGIWTANNLDSTVSRVAFDGSLMATFQVPDPPNAVAVGSSGVWVASHASDSAGPVLSRRLPFVRGTNARRMGDGGCVEGAACSAEFASFPDRVRSVLADPASECAGTRASSLLRSSYARVLCRGGTLVALGSTVLSSSDHD